MEKGRPQRDADSDRPPTWQIAMQRAIRSVDALLEYLQLTPEQVPELERDSAFPLLVPWEFVQRMRPGEPRDPLLLQVLPSLQERVAATGYVRDPVGDGECSPASGLLHKYASRVLLVASGMCAVHCRYCFRRHYPYDESPTTGDQWKAALDYVASHPEIDEVILSGGDPLSLGNARLSQLVGSIASIPHVRRLRVHTRFPVMIPQRIDEELLGLLESVRLRSWFVLHINHAHELDASLIHACDQLRRAGVVVLNQAVLLRGINDTIDSQFALCRDLINAGIQPYYLHQLDRVVGAAHWECDEALGHEIVQGLRERLPGYAVPRFVREVAGELSKTLLR
jgi:EF-P beta-lysylation protein EpmB